MISRLTLHKVGLNQFFFRKNTFAKLLQRKEKQGINKL